MCQRAKVNAAFWGQPTRERGVFLGASERESTVLACLRLPEHQRHADKGQQGHAHPFHPNNHTVYQ